MLKETKDQARTLVSSLKHLGIRLKHHQALEVLAHMRGAKGWNELTGQGKPSARRLSLLQQKIVNSALQSFAEAVKENVEYLLVGATAAGDIGWLTACDKAGYDSHLSEMVLMNFYKNSQKWPLVQFFTVALKKGGRTRADAVLVHDYDEILSRTVDIEFKYNNAAVKSICPLTREQHKPYIGFYPFLAGTWDPVWYAILPRRIWAVADNIDLSTQHREWEANKPGSLTEFARAHLPYLEQPGHRLRLTFGEIKGFMEFGPSCEMKPERQVQESSPQPIDGDEDNPVF